MFLSVQQAHTKARTPPLKNKPALTVPAVPPVPVLPPIAPVARQVVSSLAKTLAVVVQVGNGKILQQLAHTAVQIARPAP